MRDNQDAAAMGDRGQSGDAQRFAEQIPDWISGHLPQDAAQWMAEMATQHPDWAQDVQWMRDLRSQVQQHTQSESTDASWVLLQQRLQAEPAAATPERALWQRRRRSTSATQSPEPSATAHRARVLRWWRNPVWGNALASVALAVVLGHAGWQLWSLDPAAQTPAQGAAWRSAGLEDLAPASPAVWHAAVQLPASLTASQWHGAVVALGAGVQVQSLADGRWQLLLPMTRTQAQWRAQLLAQPGMAQVQWQDLSADLPAAAPQP